MANDNWYPALGGPSTPSTNLSDTGVGDMATRATFLSLFIILGFVGNCVLIATITQSSRLRGFTINLCILSLAAANIVDSCANMPLILGATITEKWDYGKTACHINAFGIQLVSIVVIVGITLLTLDRVIAVADPHKHSKRMGKKKLNVFIIFTWLHAIGFSIPLLLDKVVPIKVFPVRYLCTISTDTPLLYLCLTSIFAYLIPIFMCFGFFIYIIKRGVTQKLKDKKRRSQEGYAEGNISPNKLWAEIEGATYAGVLFGLWIILQGPYLVLSSIMWYRNSSELSNNANVTDFLYFEYPWELELALTWLKLSYPVVLPALTLLWKKEVWQKFKNKILCRKGNHVLDSSPNSSPEHRLESGILSSSNGVPVLFATENGLHFKTFEDDEDDDGSSEGIDPDTDVRENSTSQIATTKKCDVMGSQDFLQLDEDTSDYDSSGEIDPFSNSNPISVRTEYERQKSHGSNRSGSSASRSRINTMNGAENGAFQDVKQAVENADKDVVVKPKIVTETAREKKKNKRHRQNSSGGSQGSVIPGEINHGAVIEEDEAIDGSVERTSRDSGMGSLEKYNDVLKKSKRQKSTSQNKESIPKPVENGGKIHVNSPEPTKRKSKIISVEQRPVESELSQKDTNIENQSKESIVDLKDEEPVVRKKKRKKPQVNVSDQHIDESIINDEVHGNSDKNGPIQTKPPIRLKPIPHKDKETTVDGAFLKGPKLPELHQEASFRPKPAERKINLEKQKKAISEKKLRSQDVVDHRKNEDCECETEQTPNKTEETIIDHGCDEAMENINELQNDLPKPRKKRKKKKVNPESPQKTPAEELDEEIQGVLY